MALARHWWECSNSVFVCSVLLLCAHHFRSPKTAKFPDYELFQDLWGATAAGEEARTRGSSFSPELPLQQGCRLETAAVALFLVDAPRIDATNRRPSRRTPPRDDLKM